MARGAPEDQFTRALQELQRGFGAQASRSPQLDPAHRAGAPRSQPLDASHAPPAALPCQASELGERLQRDCAQAAAQSRRATSGVAKRSRAVMEVCVSARAEGAKFAELVEVGRRGA